MADVRLQRGQFVELDGLLAVVVGTDLDPWVPEDHVAIWFGEPRTTRSCEGGLGGQRPEIWTVPVEHCTTASEPVVRH